MNAGRPEPPASPPASRPPREPLDWPAQAGAVSDVLREMQGRLKAKRRRRVRSTVGVSLVLLAAALTWRITRPIPSASGPEHSVVISLPDEQVLPDGSVVQLRPSSHITVAFTDALRRVTLDKGEAHFQVAHNHSRPFIVTAGGVEFRAVGTAFDVHLGERQVEMVVTEGRVAVDQPNPAPAAPARTLALVDQGNRVLVDVEKPQVPVSTVAAVSPAEINQRLAWRAPRLEFSATPLSEVVNLINAHAAPGSNSRLVLGDRSLAGVRISGILRADNIDTLLGVLDADYGIKGVKQGDAQIVLRRAP